MKATKLTKVTVLLELSEPDAHWLRGIMQNKLNPNEITYDDKMRSSLFNELNTTLEKTTNDK